MSQQLSGQIAVLVLFYNKLEQTAECIDSFLLSGENIYVLNNGSATADFLALQKQFQSNGLVHFLDAGENLGPAGGRNYLIQHTTEPWLVFVDNDITIKPTDQWRLLLENFLAEDADAEIICPRIYNVHEVAYMDRLRLHMKGRKLELNNTQLAVTNFFPEGGVIIRRSIFERYGLYDEKMFAFEGYELALRAMLSSFGELKVRAIATIELIHDHRFQQKAVDKEAVRYRYNNQKHHDSYNRITEKYGIEFDHDWNWWVQNQREKMTVHPLLVRVRNKLRRFFFHGS
jgi:GT2 family glycosyltransferase